MFGDCVTKVLDFVLSILNGMRADGELSSVQAIVIVLLSLLIVAMIVKAKEIISLLKWIRNSKLDGYCHILNGDNLKNSDRNLIERDVSKIIRYRITGICDVEKQNIIIKLLSHYGHKVPNDFFKKFRNFLIIKEGRLFFKKELGFRFECFLYGFYALQFLALSFLFIALSIYKGDALSLGKHVLLYLMVAVLFPMFIAFWKMIPLPKECALLAQILDAQSD